MRRYRRARHNSPTCGDIISLQAFPRDSLIAKHVWSSTDPTLLLSLKSLVAEKNTEHWLSCRFLCFVLFFRSYFGSTSSPRNLNVRVREYVRSTPSEGNAKQMDVRVAMAIIHEGWRGWFYYKLFISSIAWAVRVIVDSLSQPLPNILANINHLDHIAFEVTLRVVPVRYIDVKTKK